MKLRIIFSFNLFFIQCIAIDKNIKLVILNGPSSTGKSTIAKNLKEIVDDSWQIVHFSSLRQEIIVPKTKELKLVPDDYNFINLPFLYRDVRTNILKNVNLQQAWMNLLDSADKTICEHIATLISENKKIIVDVNLFQKSLLAKFLEIFKDINLCFVFLHLPFDKIAERVNKRNTYGSQKDFRFMNQVIDQYTYYYSSKDKQTNNSVEFISENKIKELVPKWTHNKEAFAFIPTGLELSDSVINSLKINENKKFLEPKFIYDIVINSYDCTPQEKALKIKDLIKLNKPTDFFKNK